MGNAADDLKDGKRAKDAVEIGDPRLTVRLRNEYGKARTDSEMAGDGNVGKWEEWLDDGGYGLDGRGHAYRKK